MNTANERFFYHSFPRPQRKSNSVSPGLNVLASMLKSGLLLTPEVICWEQDGGQLCHLQRRICFTELCPTELPSHRADSCPFALELTADNLRELGGIPVFYVPSCSGTSKGFHGAGTTLVFAIAEVGVLLNHLREIKNVDPKALQSPPAWQYSWDGNKGWLSNLPAAQEAIAAVTKSIRALEQLCFVPDALQNLLLPTENLNHTQNLHYYYQREWRIIENFAIQDRWFIRDLEQEERELLVAQEPFFQKELAYPFLGNPKIVEQCKYYSRLEQEPVMSRVRRIFVPPAAFREAKRLVDDSGLKIQVVEAAG